MSLKFSFANSNHESQLGLRPRVGRAEVHLNNRLLSDCQSGSALVAWLAGGGVLGEGLRVFRTTASPRGLSLKNSRRRASQSASLSSGGGRYDPSRRRPGRRRPIASVGSSIGTTLTASTSLKISIHRRRPQHRPSVRNRSLSPLSRNLDVRLRCCTASTRKCRRR